MRLRSSQLVFLMLLVCSARVGEECAAQLTATVAGPVRIAAATRDTAPAHSDAVHSLSSPDIPAPSNALDPAARAAHLVVWIMPSPSSASAAIVSHTSLARA